MSKVISCIALICQNGSSNKFYDIQIVLENDQLSMRSLYGAIGSSPKKGVGGSFVLDMKEAAANPNLSKLTNDVANLVNEANSLAQTKLKKGYTPTTGQGRMITLDVVDALDSIYDISATTAKQNAPKPPAGSIDVEVIGMVAGVAKVAKVLADFSYEVLGELKAPSQRSLKIGQVVKVHQQNGRLILV